MDFRQMLRKENGEINVGFSLIFLLAAILVFLLVVFNAKIGSLTEVRLTALGLAFFAAAHLPI